MYEFKYYSSRYKKQKYLVRYINRAMLRFVNISVRQNEVRLRVFICLYHGDFKNKQMQSRRSTV